MIQLCCPFCQNKFEASESQQGKRIKCPDCATNFVVEGKTGVQKASSKAPPRAPAAPKRPASAADLDEVDEVEEVEEVEAPASRRRDGVRNDEDGRPRRRGRPDEDDDEEKKPTRRNRRDEDEDEDRPKRRGRRDEDDEDEKPSRRGSESGGGFLLWGGVIGLALLLLIGGGITTYFLLQGGKAAEQAKAEKEEKEEEEAEEQDMVDTDPRLPTSAPPNNAEEVEAGTGTKPGPDTRPGPDTKPGPDTRPDDTTPPKTVTEALALLSSPDDVKAGRALTALMTLPVEEGQRDAVGRAINPALGRPGTWKQALAVARRWESKQNLPKLIEMLGRRDAFSEVADALGATRDEGAARALAKHLADPTQSAKASECLRGMGPMVAEKAVLACLNHEKEAARAAAAALLDGFGTSAEKRSEQLAADLGSAAPKTRQAALKALQAVPATEKGLAAAIGLLADKNEDVREAAVKCLLKWDTPRAVPALFKALDDDDVRLTVLEGLVGLKSIKGLNDEKAALALVVRLKLALPNVDTGPEKAKEAKLVIQTLAAIGPNAEGAVLDLLPTPNLQSRGAACLILAQIGTTKSIAPLRKYCRTPRALATASAQAVRAIQAREKGKPAVEKKDGEKKDK